MIQRLIVILLIVTESYVARSQSSIPYWRLSGNSNTTSASLLGTTNAMPLRLSTNNVPRVYISSGGRIGIGTISPMSSFHVEGPTLLSVFVSTDVLSPTSGSGVIGYTKGMPTARGQRLGYFLTGSQGGGSNPGNGTGMVGYADGAWSTNSHPSYLSFETAPANSIIRAERLRINSEGRVGIGTSAPAYRLQVVDSVAAVSGVGLGAASYGVIGTGKAYGVAGFAIPANGTGCGVYGVGTKFGVYGSGEYGIYGSGYHGVYGLSSSAAGIAVTGYATGTDDGIGFNQSTGGEFQSVTGYGLVAHTQNPDRFAGFFSGDIYTNGVYQSSDRGLKKNIVEFNDALSIIAVLHPKVYEFQTDGNMAEMSLPKGKHYGLIAQDLESVLPNLVKETMPYRPRHGDSAVRSGAPSVAGKRETFKAVNYTELIPILIKAIQEQTETQKKDEEEIQTLKAEIQAMQKGPGNSTLAAFSSARLEVASPNPAKSSTIIRYDIPETATSARLSIIDISGKVVKEFYLSGRSGQVSLNVSGLSSGSYPCTLWLNGQPVISKQLIVAK